MRVTYDTRSGPVCSEPAGEAVLDRRVGDGCEEDRDSHSRWTKSWGSGRTKPLDGYRAINPDVRATLLSCSPSDPITGTLCTSWNSAALELPTEMAINGRFYGDENDDALNQAPAPVAIGWLTVDVDDSSGTTVITLGIRPPTGPDYEVVTDFNCTTINGQETCA